MADQSHPDAGEGAPRREDPLADLIQVLLDNPWLKQGLALALDARERASVAGTHAIRGLNIPTASDTERLERRLRALSERLEEVEDSLDELSRELSDLRRSRAG